MPMMTDAEIEDVRKLFKSKKPFNHRAWGLILILELRELRRQLRKEKIAGIRLAADVAKDYDKMSYHGYLVSDCILGKLNVLKGQPRKNPDAKRISEALGRVERKVDSALGTARLLAAAARVPGRSRRER